VAPSRGGRPRPRPGLVALGIPLALALLSVVLVTANSGDTTNGTGGADAGGARATSPDARTTSTPQHPPRRRAGTSASRTASAGPPAPRPSDLPSALSGLRTAITVALAGNGLSPGDAQDLLRRVDALAATPVRGPPPGPGNGPGKGHGHGKDKVHGDGKTSADLTGPLDDFAHHLDDLRARGAITPSAYDSIQSAMTSVRSFAASTGGGDVGGDGGG